MGLRFSSQKYIHSQPSGTPVPRNMVSISGFCMHCSQVEHRHLYRLKDLLIDTDISFVESGNFRKWDTWIGRSLGPYTSYLAHGPILIQSTSCYSWGEDAPLQHRPASTKFCPRTQDPMEHTVSIWTKFNLFSLCYFYSNFLIAKVTSKCRVEKFRFFSLCSWC